MEAFDEAARPGVLDLDRAMVKVVEGEGVLARVPLGAAVVAAVAGQDTPMFNRQSA